jgi:FKBP-type peptidyl-prolyl cis-trans isomerase FklB
LQLMRMGERWMLYIPYQSGYGINDYTAPYSTNTIPGGSLLTFDLQLVSFAE